MNTLDIIEKINLSDDATFIEFLSSAITYISQSQGVSLSTSEVISKSVIDAVKFKYSRCRVTIKLDRPSLEKTKKIKDEYNGSNMMEIIERYGVSRSTVYRMLKRK